MELILDAASANIAIFAITAHATEREAHIREFGQSLPEGSYDKRNRQSIAARQTSIAARLRAVESAYRTATEHDIAYRLAEPATARRPPEQAADREIELE